MRCMKAKKIRTVRLNKTKSLHLNYNDHRAVRAKLYQIFFTERNERVTILSILLLRITNLCEYIE